MATTLDKNIPKNKKLDKHQAIVDAARELFTTVGYENTTIAEVARKAGVAVGTVYLYFKNKNELLFAVKGDWELEFISYFNNPELQNIPHFMRARPIIEGCFGLCEKQTEMIQMMGLQAQEIGATWHTDKDSHPVVHEGLKTFFDQAVEAGYFRPIDTAVGATLAFGMVSDALYQCFYIEGGHNQQRYIDALVDLMENWLVKPEYRTGQ
jgi:AcrR family transcriptional regulator